MVPRLADALHASRLALFYNPDMAHRVDMLRGVDGIFDEMGDAAPGVSFDGWVRGGHFVKPLSHLQRRSSWDARRDT